MEEMIIKQFHGMEKLLIKQHHGIEKMLILLFSYTYFYSMKMYERIW